MSKDFKMKGFESKDGILKLYDERVVLFPPNIITLLGSVFGKGSKSLLVYLGKKMGRKLVENWEENLKPQNMKELVNIFFDMSAKAGWGNIKVIESSESKIIIQVFNNIAKKEEQPLNHICDFLTGYFAGFGEFIMYSADVKEIKCSINEDIDHCEFVIAKR